MALDQALGDRGAGAVELGGAVAGLAEQNDAGIGEAVDEFGEGRIVDTGQQFGMQTMAQSLEQLLRAGLINPLENR